MMTVRSLLVTAVATASLLACSTEQERELAAWEPVVAAELSAPQQAQEAQATAARDAMMANLMGALSAELKASGPAAAITVCKDVAPAIADSVGKQFGVRIGRVSHKLRNPNNVAPAWADELLADEPGEPRMAVGPHGSLGITTPIRIASKCLLCHGPADALGADVRAALGTLYPHDAATGYREGDLRGWFWVEVAAAAE